MVFEWLMVWLLTTKPRKCFILIRCKERLISLILILVEEPFVRKSGKGVFKTVRGFSANRQVWFTLKKLSIPGIPDGMAIDTDGNLWVAVFGGSRVLKVDGNKRETLLDTINIPAEQVNAASL